MDATAVHPIEESQTLDSIRYIKLLSVLDRSLSSVVDAFKLEDLQAIFPDLAREIPEKLADTHEQISTYLRNSANSDFQAIMMQYDMPTKLASLDKLIVDADEREATPGYQAVPSLSPELINRSRAVAIKRKELERLEAKLALLREENSRGISLVNEQETAIIAEKNRLAETVDLVNKVCI
ncbi:hypothetical protein LPJ66_005580 [Kickxella alabastrina]|uniref:Uncharacterized protein n=1 Tax=Kickxella alabastrina TaxID=61397 RepID=A0ACC1II47_9FUNG|nr:hypothetical protein LPJ66_005580 [Kickxella alabastrina]